MRKRKQQNKRSYFDPIPYDIVINILSRLPVKSKAQCRCVSKLLSSIIRRPNYNQLFPIKPPVTPRILFAFNVGSKLFFYSSPQPQNPDNTSSLVATQHHYAYLGKDFCKLSRPVRGRVCSQHIDEKKYSWAVISNPITGEYVTTPKVTLEGISGFIEGKAEYSFGYDPIDKQFKVLRITWFCLNPHNWYAKYHVLTLGTGDKNHPLLWRKIQCCAFHYPLDDNGICIDGVLYYPAVIHNRKLTMVCFDVRSEKFSFIDLDQDLGTRFEDILLINEPLVLINYKGKLGFIVHGRHFELWVLEEAEKHRWLIHSYNVPIMPHALLDARGYVHVRPAGVIGSGEIVSYPMHTLDPFFIFYSNLEGNIFTRVRLEVPVAEESNYCRVYTFLNYVEDVELISTA